MDVNKILMALRRERAQIDQVIVNLEVLALSRERRRGRPRTIVAQARKRGRPAGSKNRVVLSSARTQSSSNGDRPPRVLAAGQAVVSEPNL
jgi:hypothetical protein